MLDGIRFKEVIMVNQLVKQEEDEGPNREFSYLIRFGFVSQKHKTTSFCEVVR